MTLFDQIKSFGIVCHDAGGANQIAAMIQQLDLKPAFAFVKGPAELIWDRYFPDITKVNDFSRIKEVSALITGTGWASDNEHQARIEAKAAGIFCIAVLDHWVNYRERFIRDGVEVLPDEIWVVDFDAEAMARSLFPGIPITLMPDFYAEREIIKIGSVTSETPNNLLYLLEPFRSHWGRGEAGEFQAMRYFFRHLPDLGLPEMVQVILRPHPSDTSNKYTEFLGNFANYTIRMSGNDLSEDITLSRWVAGGNTYAMTLALRANRVVFGTLPPWAPLCSLPHRNIIHLRCRFPT